MKVSVILTSYNHEKFIRRSIESVLNQTYKDFKLIIIDDCSSDSSWNIIQQFKDERIVAVRNPKNMRTEGFYNALHKYVDGTYLAVHHSDDEWMPDKLEKQVAFMDNHTEVAACFTQVQVIDESENNYSDEEGFYYNLFNQENRSRYEWLNYFFYHGNCLCHPSVMIRSKLFFEEEMFDFGYAQIPDFSRWVRICLNHEIYILPERLTRFRIQNNEKNTSGNRADTIIRSSIEWFHLLHLYSNFKTAEEFVKVFPEGKEFAKRDAYIPQYAFARICTRPEMESYTRLFGFELLYKLMNDREIATKIEREYGFTFRNLIEMTGQKDIFHVLEEGSNQQMNVYLYFEDGEDCPIRVEKRYYLKDYYKFDWKIEIPEEYQEKEWVKVRFDPAEALYILCTIESAQIDDQDLEMKAFNAIDMMENYQVFENMDPMYVSGLLKRKIHRIHLRGEVKRLDSELQNKFNALQERKRNQLYEEISQRDIWLNQLQNEKKDMRELIDTQKADLDLEVNENKKLQNENFNISEIVRDLRECNQKIVDNNRSLEIELEKVKTELLAIKEHKVYRIMKKINNIHGGKK